MIILIRNQLRKELRSMPEWIEEAEKLYQQGISFAQIGRQLNVNRKLVSYYLQQKGYSPNHKFQPKIKVKQKTQKAINEDIFEIIDTQEKAYWLGFMYADGSVAEKNNRIELALQEEDYDHIVKFKNFMGSDHQIQTKCKVMNEKTYIGYRLGFNNAKIKTDLIALGCIPNKTKVLEFPKLPNELIRHFIRGYFDADGCITKHRTSGISLEILGTDEFLKGVANHYNIQNHIYRFNHSDIKRFMIAGQGAIAIMEDLYREETICLKRKKEKFKNILGEIA